MVRPGRHGTAERLEQKLLAGGVGQVVVAADDVRDAHVPVVDDGGEVVAGDAVGADDDGVAERVRADDDPPADQVVDDDLPRGHLEAHGGRLARVQPAPHLLGRQREAAAVVARRAPGGERLAAQLLEALLGAEAAVGEPRREQLVGRGAVPLEPFALPVRAEGTSGVRPLVPLEAEPAQVGHDGALERGV